MYSPKKSAIARRRGQSLIALTAYRNPDPDPTLLTQPQRTASSPLLSTNSKPQPVHYSGQVSEDSDVDAAVAAAADDEVDFLIARRNGSARLRSGGGMRRRVPITTGHGTETEEEPVPNLPNARIVSPQQQQSDAALLVENLKSILFYCLRFLAVIPAFVATVVHLVHVVHPPPVSPLNYNTRADYLASAAWSILTAIQCFYFTTGLLTRWKVYYPLLPTLIRLLGLQAICWPATHYTLVFLQYDGHMRPLLCWTVIGTTTCITRSIVLWVTSNIWEWDHPKYPNNHHAVTQTATVAFGEKVNEKWRGRKWDWNEVVWKCMFPAGFCYFFTAWSLLLSREFQHIRG